jgi:hypothetical protein
MRGKGEAILCLFLFSMAFQILCASCQQPDSSQFASSVASGSENVPERQWSWEYVATKTVNTVALSGDGRFLFAGTAENYVYLFSTMDRSPLYGYDTGSAPDLIESSYDGGYILVANGTTVKLLSNRGESLSMLWSFVVDPEQTDARYAGVASIAFSADGSCVAVGTWVNHNSYRRTWVFLFETVTGNTLWSYKVSDQWPPYTVEKVRVDVSSDGQYIVACSDVTNKVYLFNKTGSVFTYDTGAPVRSVSISRDGRWFVCGGDRVYYFDRQIIVPKWPRSIGSSLSKVIISELGNFVIATSSNALYVLSGTDGEAIWNYTLAGPVTIDFSRTGDRILAMINDTCRIFSVLTDGNTSTPSIHDPIQTIAFNKPVVAATLSETGTYAFVSCGTGIYVFLFEKPATYLTNPSTVAIYSRDVTISTMLTDAKGMPIPRAEVTFGVFFGGKWNSIGSNITETDGRCVKTYSVGLPAGVYPLEVAYTGSMYYNGSSFFGNLTVYKERTSISLAEPHISTDYGDSVVISCSLIDNEGIVLGGMLADFRLNVGGSWITIGQNITGMLGQAGLEYIANLLPSNYQLSVTFNGDQYYEGCQISGELAVEKESVSLSDPSVSALYDTQIGFSIQLTDDEMHSLEGHTVTIGIYVGPSYRLIGSGSTNDNGYATISYTVDLEPGIYVIEVRCIENQYFDGQAVNGTFLVVSRVIVDASAVTKERADIGSLQYVLFHSIWEYDATSVTAGTIYVNGSEAVANSSGWAKLEVGSTSVGVRSWVVTGVNFSGVTVFTQQCLGASIIWDRVHVNLLASDQRIDVGTNASISYNAYYEYDGKPFEGSLVLNNSGTVLLSVGKTTYAVARISENKYGLTVFSSNSVTIVWDRIDVTLAADNERIDIGTNASITVLARYAFDETPMQGSWSLNDTSFSSSTVARKSYLVNQIIDDKYGLTAFSSNMISIIWDRVRIDISADDERIDVGTNASITISAHYEYDNMIFEGEVLLNDTLFSSSPTLKCISVSGVIDGVHNLTSFSSSNISIIWDRVRVTITVNTDRIEVGRTISITTSAFYVFDGTSFEGSVHLNDTTYISNSVGKHVFTTATIVDNKYNLATFSSDVVSVVWDQINVESAINLVAPGTIEIGVKLRYASDGAPANDTTVIIDGMEAVKSGNGEYVHRTSGWALSTKAAVQVRSSFFNTLNRDVEGYVGGNIIVLVVLPTLVFVPSSIAVFQRLRGRAREKSEQLIRRVESEIVDMRKRNGTIDLDQFGAECKVKRDSMIRIIENLGIEGVYFSKDKGKIYCKEWLRTQLREMCGS